MGRTVLVTGASGGIGAAVVSAFARQGDRVIAAYHTGANRAGALCDRLESKGYAVSRLQADVSREDGVERLFHLAEEKYGPVEVLVNNAGFAQQKLFQDITPAEWDSMFAVHVRGSYLCCRRALPNMLKAQKGSIVNLSSMWGQVGASCEVHYSAAKAAVIGMTKALAKELAPSGIRVNCVAPGAIDTPMLHGLGAEGRALLEEEIPMGRLGTSAEVADAVVYMASDAAGYLTGQVLAPNGGMVV